MDELGRGTSTRDGLATAIAIAEALIQSDAHVYFATHFVELGRSSMAIDGFVLHVIRLAVN